MKRHNDDGKPNKSDVNKTSQDGAHSNLNVHSSFPKPKAPIDTESHPDFHNFKKTRAPSGPTVEMPQTSKTGPKKGVQVPFRGANS